jgi:hypothetical protein
MTTLALMQMRFEGNNRMAPQGSYLVAASLHAISPICILGPCHGRAERPQAK